ncbi:ricin-type beta-trefoil lectin domain protein [Actinoplanes sp. NPDC023714]|uniref:ricin-type beta-trefoil lectin domain protein n=1 Tax=Actinoplanes sp. NPDC023714 TaxID=3154322 RepID=UPI0034048961
MKTLRIIGTLGVAMIVAVAGLLLRAAPASAAGDVRYENVGNPGWCLDGNGDDVDADRDGSPAYLHRCNAGNDFQVWTVEDWGWMKVKHRKSGKCLRVSSSNLAVDLGPCAGAGTDWYAAGMNGWVRFFTTAASPLSACLQPFETWRPGLEAYPLVANACSRTYPKINQDDLRDVPNIVAWRIRAV